jgi:hypothetical protein
LVGEPERRRPLESVGINWRVILMDIKGTGGVWTEFMWLRRGTSGMLF